MITPKSISHSYSYLIIVFSLSTGLFAQQDSVNIRQRILESEESEQMLIQRTRNFILTKLKAGSINEAYEAYRFALQKYETETVKPFWVTEKFLLGFWFGKYETIYIADSIENALEFERNERWNAPREYLYPQKDKLALELRLITNKHRAELNQRIDSLVSDKEQHDYLVLFLEWLTFNATEPEMTNKLEIEYLEKRLTPKAEEFLSSYRNSPFQPFVKRHFRFKFALNDWGYGYYLGMGSLSPQGIAGQYLNPEILLGMGFELSWNNALLDIGFDVGIPASIRKPFIHDGKAWNTNVRNNYYTYYFTTGWVIQETDKFKLQPHIGFGGINMSVSEADKNKTGDDLSMTQAAILYGIACDIKIETNEISYKENRETYSGISVGLDYFQFLGSNPIMSDGMLRFRISWIGFGRSILRDL